MARKRGQSHDAGRIRRIDRLRQVHVGPFTGGDIRRVLEKAGFGVVAGGDANEFLIFGHPDGRVAMLDPAWDGIHAGGAIFNVLQRDLRVSKRALLRRLNDAQNHRTQS